MKIYIVGLLILPTISLAEISRNNEVDWVLASTKTSGGSHMIEWKNALENANDCVFSGANRPRTRLSIDDKAAFSMLLAAKMTKMKVGFYYNLNTTLPVVAGHGSGCEITNAWLESD